MEEFCERLKFLREEKGLTQKEVAEAIGFAQSAVAFWANGKRIPNAFAIVALAKFFDVTSDYLLGLTKFS